MFIYMITKGNRNIKFSGNEKLEIERIVKRMLDDGRGKQYDCIMGLS